MSVYLSFQNKLQRPFFIYFFKLSTGQNHLKLSQFQKPVLSAQQLLSQSHHCRSPSTATVTSETQPILSQHKLLRLVITVLHSIFTVNYCIKSLSPATTAPHPYRWKANPPQSFAVSSGSSSLNLDMHNLEMKLSGILTLNFTGNEEETANYPCYS